MLSLATVAWVLHNAFEGFSADGGQPLSEEQKDAAATYAISTLLLGVYMMLFSGNFLLPTRMLFGGPSFALLVFYGNSRKQILYEITGWEPLKDSVAAALAGGLIGGAAAMYSYRLAALMAHLLAAHNIWVVLGMLIQKGLEFPKRSNDVVAALVVAAGALCVVLPWWQKLLRPSIILSGAVAGTFTALAGAALICTDFSLWTPGGRLDPAGLLWLWDVYKVCTDTGSCSIFLTSFLVLTTASALLQGFITCPAVNGYSNGIARHLFKHGELHSPAPTAPTGSASRDVELSHAPLALRLSSEHVVLDDPGGDAGFDQDFFNFRPMLDTTGAKIYMCSVLILTVVLVSVVSFTIDWGASHFALAFSFFMMSCFLTWGVADFFVGSVGFHIVRLLWDFPPLASEDFSRGLPNERRTFICYCLLSQAPQSSEETFAYATECYLGNLDPNLNVCCGVVSVTSKLSVLQCEARLLQKWRNEIRSTLQADLEEIVEARRKGWPQVCPLLQNTPSSSSQDAAAVTLEIDVSEPAAGGGASPSGGDCLSPLSRITPQVPEARRRFWAVLIGDGTSEEPQAILERLQHVPDRAARGFYWLHRSCKVLKKPGQYQDLAALTYRGHTQGYTYTDPQYGANGRQPGLPAFGFHGNVTQDQADASPSIEEMEAALQEDVTWLADCGRKVATRFQYTMVMDKDTRSEPGGVLRLVEIAARNPQFGIFQPALRVDDTKGEGTWYMFLESLRQVSSSNLPLAMFSIFQRYGFYGKGLISNRLMLKRLVGDAVPVPRCDIEALPVDILSHDTYEAKLLRPCYVKEVCLMEEPARNQISALIQSTRWMLGEVRNAAYPPGTFRSMIRFLQLAYHAVFGCRRHKPPFVRHELLPASRSTEYLATMTFRVMHAGPAILFIVILRNAEQAQVLEPIGWLKFKNGFLAIYGTIFTAISLFVAPKLLLVLELVPSLRLNWPSDPSQRPPTPRARRRAQPQPEWLQFKKLALSVFEAIISVFIFGPECIMGMVRMVRAYHAHISGKVTWKPQDQVDREIQEQLSLVLVLKNTWLVPSCGLFMMVWNAAHHIWDPFSTLLWVSWCMHPAVVWFGCQELGEAQRRWWFVRWVRELKSAAKERHNILDTAMQVSSFMVAY